MYAASLASFLSKILYFEGQIFDRDFNVSSAARLSAMLPLRQYHTNYR